MPTQTNAQTHRTERTRGENKSCIKLDSNPLFVRCVLYHCHCLMSHERMIEIVLFNLQHSNMSLNFVLHLLFKLLPRKKRIKTRNPKLCAFNWNIRNPLCFPNLLTSFRRQRMKWVPAFLQHRKKSLDTVADNRGSFPTHDPTTTTMTTTMTTTTTTTTITTTTAL